MSGFEHIVVERREKIYLVRINRPEVLNAISYETTLELDRAWNDFRNDPDAWVGILTGTGERAFSAGADLKARAKTGLVQHLERANIPFGGLTGPPKTWKPIIAAINGLAFGGGLELALACDLRLTVPHAQFTLPESEWGLMPRSGLVRLPRMMPSAKAMEVILMAKRLSAQDALQFGLVNEIVPQEQLIETAFQWAERICQLSPLAIRASKEVAYRSQDMPLDQALGIDEEHVRNVAGSEDAQEGVRAFMEKRKPSFQGR